MEGLLRLSADLGAANSKLREWFDRERTPEGTLNDAGLWTVLKEAEREYEVELEPLVAELTEKQRNAEAGQKLQLSFVQLVEVVKGYVSKQAKAGQGKQGGESKRGKAPKPSLPEVQPKPQSPILSSPSAQLSGSKSSQELILEARLKDKKLTDWLPSASPVRHPKATRPSRASVPQAKTAELVLADWQSRSDEIKVLYSSEGPMKTIEALAGQSDLVWSEDLAALFQEMMGKRSSDGEEEDAFRGVFWPAVEDWVRSNPGVQASFVQSPTDQLAAKLKSTIEEVESISRTQEFAGQDSSQSRQLLQTLKLQLRRIEESAGKQGEDPVFLQRCRGGIHEVYVFYAKQTKMIGTKPSFDDILHSISILSSGKFFKFLHDFQLLSDSKLSTRKSLDKSTAMSIFRKTALFQKEMNEQQFTMALDLVAMAYYDGEFDRVNRTDIAKLPMGEKRERLYRTLGFDQEGKYREKMKGYGVPFSSYTDYRIPEDDPARRYRYKEYKHQRVSLEQWRERMRGAPTVQEIPEEPVEPPRKLPKKPKKQVEEMPALDSSDLDLNDLINNSASNSSDSPSPTRPPPSKSTSSLFQSPKFKPNPDSSRADTLLKSSQTKENEALARALKAANAQMEKGQRVALRMGAAANKYKA